MYSYLPVVWIAGHTTAADPSLRIYVYKGTIITSTLNSMSLSDSSCSEGGSMFIFGSIGTSMTVLTSSFVALKPLTLEASSSSDSLIGGGGGGGSVGASSLIAKKN
jgi:hypothetical protein